MENKWILETKEDSDGNIVIDLPEDLLEQAGWKEGDTIKFDKKEDGTIIMTKSETQLVMVECISQFRQRYLVEVPTGIDKFGKDKVLWALDTVTMEEAKEFSQQHLGETIVSHRVVSEEEALRVFREDNDYLSDWSDDLIKKNAFTTWNLQVDDNNDE